MPYLLIFENVKIRSLSQFTCYIANFVKKKWEQY